MPDRHRATTPPASLQPQLQRTAETLLSVAGHAAPSSERWAAPLACWVVARARVDPADGLACARTIMS